MNPNMSKEEFTANYLKRIELFLEDEDWNKADEYCKKILDIDAECAAAYLYIF